MKNLFYFSALVILFASCIKTKGEISMTYDKATAVYGSLDSIRQLPLLIKKQELIKPKNFYIGSDFVLVSESNKGIHIYDNTDMQNPQRMSFIQLPFLRDFYVKDNFLYVANVYDFLKIDITNVYDPILVSRAENVFWEPLENDKGQQLLGFKYETATDKFEVNSTEAKEIKKAGKLHLDFLKEVIPVSQIPSTFAGGNSHSKGTLNRIAAEFGFVYVIEDDVMHVISNDASFSQVSTLKIDATTETIYGTENRLFLGSMTSMTIYNADNPSAPVEISSLAHEESCDPVLPRGEVAYYTLRSVDNEGCHGGGENTLNLVDISNENNPIELKSIEMLSPYGLCMANNYLFVGEGQNGLTIFDASNPNKLKKEFNIPGVVAYDIMIHPNNPNILILSNTNGIQEFLIDWNTLSLSSVGKLLY
ncbi:MAG: LVIVD repeat-containing protein [Flavobacteriia bacterium]|jgi:hypothetical protein